MLGAPRRLGGVHRSPSDQEETVRCDRGYVAPGWKWQCPGETGLDAGSWELRPAPRLSAMVPPAPPAANLHVDPGPRACAEAPFTLLAGDDRFCSSRLPSRVSVFRAWT